jgi:hypothetical protein
VSTRRPRKRRGNILLLVAASSVMLLGSAATFVSRVLSTRANRHGPAAGAGPYAPMLVPTP